MAPETLDVEGHLRKTENDAVVGLGTSFHVTTIAILICIRLVYRLFFHPLARFPGPILAKITSAWRNKKYIGGQWHQDILDLHSKYGRVVRIAPNELSIVDESAMRNLYGHGHNVVKTSWYNIWDPPGTTSMFSVTDQKTHAFLRKRVAQAYSMTSILKYEKHIQGCLDLLLDKLKQHAEKGGVVVDMATWTNAFAFDVIGELAYGEQLGHVRTETDVNGLREAISGGFFALSSLGHIPLAATLISSKITARIVPNPFGAFVAWSSKRVNDRVENQNVTDREDMLNQFCRMKDSDGSPVSAGEILVEAMGLVGAGADTTAIGMNACLLYLSQSPKHYKLVQLEIDNFYIENDLAAPISYLETQQLPVLQAVVKEATRLHPSISFQLLRYAPPSFSVCGKRIPAGTPVGINPIAQNRDRQIWGADADDFRPERWLESEARTKYLDSSTMTFGGNGPRMCIGRNIALVEIHKFLAQFMHSFDFKIVDKTNPWRVATHWFSMQRDMKMEIRARNTW